MPPGGDYCHVYSDAVQVEPYHVVKCLGLLLLYIVEHFIWHREQKPILFEYLKCLVLHFNIKQPFPGGVLQQQHNIMQRSTTLLFVVQRTGANQKVHFVTFTIIIIFKSYLVADALCIQMLISLH